MVRFTVIFCKLEKNCANYTKIIAENSTKKRKNQFTTDDVFGKGNIL